MRKGMLVTSVLGTVGVAALASRKNTKLKDIFSNFISKKRNSDDTFQKAGHPELDHIHNSDMVDEGSQFGVNYYNKHRD